MKTDSVAHERSVQHKQHAWTPMTAVVVVVVVVGGWVVAAAAAVVVVVGRGIEIGAVFHGCA